MFQTGVFQPIVFQGAGQGLVWPVSTTTVWPADTLNTAWEGEGHDEAWPAADDAAWAAHAGGAW